MKKVKTKKYFIYGLVSIIIASGNATVIKYTSGDINAVYFNMLRYGLAALVTLPFFIRYIGRVTAKNMYYSILSGIFLSIATICYVIAISQSQATYVTLLTLISPVVLVVLTLKLTKDKVNKKHLAGFSIAALGALLVVAGPMIVSNKTDLSFYPWATVLILVNVVTFPLAIIFARKANESKKHLPLVSTIFVQVATITLLSYIFTIIIKQPINQAVSSSVFSRVVLGALYSGIGVGVVSRALSIASYEKIGSAVTGGLAYLGIFLSLAVAVIALHENISLIAVIGGAVILLGVYISESHLPAKYRHHLFIRRH